MGRVAHVRESVEGNPGFRFSKRATDIGHVAHVIDSRTLVSYPYRHMEPDKEHFLGEEMDQWADGVFDIVKRDLSAQPIASLKPLAEAERATGRAGPGRAGRSGADAGRADAGGVIQPTPAPPAEKPKDKMLHVRAKLISKTAPMPVEEFLPYQELLVGYVYEVTRFWMATIGEPNPRHASCLHWASRNKSSAGIKIGKNYQTSDCTTGKHRLGNCESEG